MLTGGCHCGAVRYEMPEEVVHHALCHCQDCRHHAGAPMVSWAMVPADQVTIRGEIQVYASSDHGRRQFCGKCGTGLFYVNEQMLPGMIDIQSVTLDNPDALSPTIHIQVAERLGWMKTAHELPEFERFPG